jgi:hypothetical protein
VRRAFGDAEQASLPFRDNCCQDELTGQVTPVLSATRIPIDVNHPGPLRIQLVHGRDPWLTPPSTERGQDVMHNILCEASPRSATLRGGWGFPMLAMVLLSLGVGAVTAAFALMNGAPSHSMQYVNCETLLQISSDPSSPLRERIPSRVEVQERVSDAYDASYEAAGDAVGSWSDVADDLHGQPFALLVAAGALAILVACARGASRLLAAPCGASIAAGSALGALLVAAIFVNAFGFPALGVRAVAFAVSVSLLAAKFAHTTRENVVPAIG